MDRGESEREFHKKSLYRCIYGTNSSSDQLFMLVNW